MDIRALKTIPVNAAHFADHDDLRAEQRPDGLKTGIHSHTTKQSKENVVPHLEDDGDIFTHAPVSLWEEDFSEVKRRCDQLKANGIEDLRKHFKKYPEEVLALARMVRISRVNKETLKLYEAAGPVEFHEGLSVVFNKDSYEIFKDEVIAFWKGRTSYASEAVNVTFTGTSKNVLIQASIPPGFEHTWARVYVAITDITAIKDSMRGLAAAEQKYRSVFDTLPTALVLADAASGMIVEANRSAKQLLGASNGDLMGVHIADLVPATEQDKVHALLSDQPGRTGIAGPVLHVRHKSNSIIPVHATATMIEINDAHMVVVSFTQADEAAPVRSSGRKSRDLSAGLGKKLTQREREILTLICSGKSSKTIAQHLSISDKTVDTHRARIMQKLDTHCVVDLVKLAMTNGLAHLR